MRSWSAYWINKYFCDIINYTVNNIITVFSYAIDGDWTHDGDIPALKNEQGHYNNMIKVKPSENPFDQVLSTKIPNPDNISRGLSGFIAEHRPFNKKIKRCLSGDETLVLSDAENVLSLSETLIDDTLDANEGENDDLLSGDEELLPTDNIISMANRRYLSNEHDGQGKHSLFLTEIEAPSRPGSQIHTKQVDSLLLISARQVETSLENIKDETKAPMDERFDSNSSVDGNAHASMMAITDDKTSRESDVLKNPATKNDASEVKRSRDANTPVSPTQGSVNSSGLVLPSWHPRKSSSRSNSRASACKNDEMIGSGVPCDNISVHSFSSSKSVNTLNQDKRLSVSSRGIKRSSLKTAEEMGKVSRSSSRASTASEQITSRKMSSGLAAPSWMSRKTSSRCSSRASGDYKGEFPIDDDVCEKQSIRSVDSTQSGDKTKTKHPKTSKRGLKMSLLKTAEQIGSTFRSASRASKASMEYTSISEIEENTEKRTDGGRHSTDGRRKSGLSRRGSVKVTDLDEYMATLERKSMTKSAKDLTGNEEAIPDLEEVSYREGGEDQPIETTTIANATPITQNDESIKLADTTKSGLSSSIDVNMDKLMDQYWTNIDTPNSVCPAEEKSEEIVKKLVIPKYLNIKQGKKDESLKTKDVTSDETGVGKNKDYTCHYSCTTIPIISQSHEKTQDARNGDAKSAITKEIESAENDLTPIISESESIATEKSTKGTENSTPGRVNSMTDSECLIKKHRRLSKEYAQIQSKSPTPDTECLIQKHRRQSKEYAKNKSKSPLIPIIGEDNENKSPASQLISAEQGTVLIKTESGQAKEATSLEIVTYALDQLIDLKSMDCAEIKPIVSSCQRIKADIVIKDIPNNSTVISIDSAFMSAKALEVESSSLLPHSFTSMEDIESIEEDIKKDTHMILDGSENGFDISQIEITRPEMEKSVMPFTEPNNINNLNTSTDEQVSVDDIFLPESELGCGENKNDNYLFQNVYSIDETRKTNEPESIIDRVEVNEDSAHSTWNTEDQINNNVTPASELQANFFDSAAPRDGMIPSNIPEITISLSSECIADPEVGLDQENNQYKSQSTASSKDERVDKTKDKDKTADNDDLISRIGATVSLQDHFESPVTNLETEIGLTDIDNGMATKTTVSSDFFTSVQPNVSCENAVDRNDSEIFSLENDVGTVEAVSITTDFATFIQPNIACENVAEQGTQPTDSDHNKHDDTLKDTTVTTDYITSVQPNLACENVDETQSKAFSDDVEQDNIAKQSTVISDCSTIVEPHVTTEDAYTSQIDTNSAADISSASQTTVFSDCSTTIQPNVIVENVTEGQDREVSSLNVNKIVAKEATSTPHFATIVQPNITCENSIEQNNEKMSTTAMDKKDIEETIVISHCSTTVHPIVICENTVEKRHEQGTEIGAPVRVVESQVNPVLTTAECNIESGLHAPNINSTPKDNGEEGFDNSDNDNVISDVVSVSNVIDATENSDIDTTASVFPDGYIPISATKIRGAFDSDDEGPVDTKKGDSEEDFEINVITAKLIDIENDTNLIKKDDAIVVKSPEPTILSNEEAIDIPEISEEGNLEAACSQRSEINPPLTENKKVLAKAFCIVDEVIGLEFWLTKLIIKTFSIDKIIFLLYQAASVFFSLDKFLLDHLI